MSQADIGSIRPPGCHLHRAQYPPLFAISPLSISLHLPPRCSDSECDALFFSSPHHTAASDTVYIIPSHSHSHSPERKEKKKKQKKKQLYLTYTCIIFLLPIPHRPALFFLSSHTLCLTVSPHACILPSCLFTPRISLYNNIPYQLHILVSPPLTYRNLLSATHHPDLTFEKETVSVNNRI